VNTDTMELAWHDLQFILRRTPSKLLSQLQKNPGRTFLAGGAIRSIIAGEPVNDFDLFVSSKDEAKALANALAKDQDRALNEHGLLPGIHETDNAFTMTQYKPSVQIIHRWTFDDPRKCIESFDFTVAQAAVWWEQVGDTAGKWVSCASSRFYMDLCAKRLIYTAPTRDEEPGGSMLRVLKFYQRGYRIPLDSLSRVMARLCKTVDFDAISRATDKEDQLAKVLCGLLREVDPNVDPDHISHLPSETETPQEEQP